MEYVCVIYAHIHIHIFVCFYQKKWHKKDKPDNDNGYNSEWVGNE